MANLGSFLRKLRSPFSGRGKDRPLSKIGSDSPKIDFYGRGVESVTTVHPAASLYHRLLSPAYARLVRFSDYEFMELTAPEIGHALNIYSGEATLGAVSPDENYFRVSSTDNEFNQTTESLLKDWIYETQQLTGLTFPNIVRRFLKYGDQYLIPVFDRDDHERKRAVGFQLLPEEQVFRVFVADKNEEYFVLDPAQKKIPPVATISSVQTPVTGLEGISDPWATPMRTYNEMKRACKRRGSEILALDEVMHIRLDPSFFYPYGTSVLERARLPWRQLRLLEDSLVIYRLIRAPERLAFLVKIGKMPPQEAEAYIEQVKQSLRKTPLAKDAQNISQAPLILGIIEDLFIPQREGAEITIDKLQQGSQVGEIDDVLMFKRKLSEALGIPKELLYGETTEELAKALVLRDARFATNVRAIQISVCAAFTQFTKLHYAKLDRNIPPFSIALNAPSGYDESSKLDTLQKRIDVASELFNLLDKLKESGNPPIQIDGRWVVRQLGLPSSAVRDIEGKPEDKLEGPETAGADLGIPGVPVP